MKILLSTVSAIMIMVIINSELSDVWKCVWSHVDGILIIMSYVVIDLYKGRLEYKDK